MIALETVARLRLAEVALARLDELAAGDCAADDAIDRARESLQARTGHTRARIDGSHAPEPDGLTDRDLRRAPERRRERRTRPAVRRRHDQPARPSAIAAQPGLEAARLGEPR